MLSYDSISGLILLLDGDTAVLIDVTLCVDHWTGGWVREHLGTIMVIGHVEEATVSARNTFDGVELDVCC